MKKPILFIDFDGTLCHDRFWRSVDPELMQKIQEYLFASDNTIIRDWMNGAYTSEDINKMVAERIGIEYKILWNVFVKDCRTMFVDQSVLQKSDELRKRYVIVLMTDNMDCFDRFTVPTLKLGNHFDLIVNSYAEKASKNDNDGKLFQEVAARMNLDLTESILVDNSERTCGIFEKRRGKAFLVTKEKPLAYWLDSL